MKPLLILLLLVTSLASGCSSLHKNDKKFQLHTGIGFSIDGERFEVVEVQSSEIQLWQGSELVGSVTTIQTNPDYQSAIKEVEEGFIEAQRGPGETSELALPDGAYGFSASFGGHTTAFIAVHNQPESWITISTRDALFEEVLSSIVIE